MKPLLPPPDDDLDAWIAKALAGDASPAELSVVRAWLDARGVDAVAVGAPGTVHALPPMPGLDVHASWTRVADRIAPPPARDAAVHLSDIRPVLARPRSASPLRQTTRRSFGVSGLTRRRWWTWAPMGLCVGAVLGWWLGRMHVSHASSASMLTYTTANGERATVALPDGSRVMLSVASRLDVPADYARGDRRVRLSGAAIFSVVHANGAPFTVQAGASTTRVLGTTFLVRHYPTDAGVNVVVREGKVAVQSSVVSAAQRAEVTGDGLVSVESASAAQLLFSSDVLTLGTQRLPEAIPDLNRWYDADIRLGDTALATRGIGGMFAAGSLENLIEFFEFTLKVRVVRNGRVLTLFSR